MLFITNGYSDSMQRDPSVKIINYSLSEEQFINIIHNTDYVSIIGHENIAEYFKDTKAINVREATTHPKVSDNIPESKAPAISLVKETFASLYKVYIIVQVDPTTIFL